MRSSIGYLRLATYEGGFTTIPCTSVPSLLLDVKSSVFASCSSRINGSFWCVRRRNAPPSKAYASFGSWVVDDTTANERSSRGERPPTTRWPVVSLSTGPPDADTFATYVTRSSSTTNRRLRLSFVQTR